MKLYLSFLLCLLFSTTSVGQEYKFNNFLVSTSAVGPIVKGMTVQDVMKFIPENQIKKILGDGEFADDDFVDYEIYDATGIHVLTITPKNGSIHNDQIERVLILDKRFMTELDVGLGSKYGTIIKNYPAVEASPDISSIIFILDEISAWMSIDKKQLSDNWWDKENNRINNNGIPLDSKIRSFVIWWH